VTVWLVHRHECPVLNPLIVALDLEVPVALATQITVSFLLTDAYAVGLTHDQSRIAGRVHSTEWMLRNIGEIQ
jgi:hypothetical protein